MNHKIATSATLTAVLSASLAMAALTPAYAADKEKCYGVSKAAQNDCGNLSGTHSCAGQSTVDNDIGEWNLVDKGTCESLGGYSKEAATKIFSAQK